MKPKLIILSILFLVVGISFGFGQTDKEKAQQLTENAIETMDAGNLDEAIHLLKDASNLDPGNYTIIYETALAYYLKEDYVQAIDILESLKGHKDENPMLYQLLGNAHDLEENPNHAMQTYVQGLNKYPDTGILYTEIGVHKFNAKEYAEAIDYWEKGAKVAPHFPSNYYRLAHAFNLTDERIWTMMYAELFMLLEPSTARTREASQLLYDNYLQSYSSTDSTSGEFLLTKMDEVIYVNDKSEIEDISLSFETHFSLIFAISAIEFMQEINLETIYNARVNFLNEWFADEDLYKKYPNALITFQKQLLDAGHFKPYTYFLLSIADYESFNKYLDKHEKEYKAFAEYMSNHFIKLEKNDFYIRSDYWKTNAPPPINIIIPNDSVNPEP